jgi:hypothetical protein
MGLPRPPEAFDRVYSPPEPPSTGRRPALIGVVTTLLAFAVAAVALLAVGGDRAARQTDGDAGNGGRSTAPSGASAPPAGAPDTGAPRTGTPATTAPPPSGQVRLFSVLPPPCGTVRPATVDRLVPRSRVEHSANTTLATCTFASKGTDSQWLRVETRIFDPMEGVGPVEAATGFFGAQWARARQDPVVRTVSLRRQEGLGDEAYRWYKLDKGQPTVVGEVALRTRNAVITVSYSGVAPGEDDSAANEQKYVAAASQVAREVLDTLE